MAKKSRGKKEEEIEDEEVQSEEGETKPKAGKKRKAPVAKKAKAKEEPAPKRKTDERPLSVGGIIIRSKGETAAWEKQAPWHRKNPQESRFRDHGTTRRAKD